MPPPVLLRLRIVKLVRAIRNGWLKQKEKVPEEPPAYLLWADDNQADTSKTATGLSYIPAPKPKLPGHAESYNPPKEYLPTEVRAAACGGRVCVGSVCGWGGTGAAGPVNNHNGCCYTVFACPCVFLVKQSCMLDHTPLLFSSFLATMITSRSRHAPVQASLSPGLLSQTYNVSDAFPLQEERASWELMDPEDRPKFMPQAFDSLRHVSGLERTCSLTNVSRGCWQGEGQCNAPMCVHVAVAYSRGVLSNVMLAVRAASVCPLSWLVVCTPLAPLMKFNYTMDQPSDLTGEKICVLRRSPPPPTPCTQ